MFHAYDNTHRWVIYLLFINNNNKANLFIKKSRELGTDDEPGVTPRAVQEVFSYIQEVIVQKKNIHTQF
jgi:hypothetical protein